MNLSPTAKHYLISFGAGMLLAGAADAGIYLTNGTPFSWPLLWAATLGGVVLFGRDYLHNNMGAFLEGTAPAVAAAVAPTVAHVVAPVVIAELSTTSTPPTPLAKVLVLRPETPAEPPQVVVLDDKPATVTVDASGIPAGAADAGPHAPSST